MALKPLIALTEIHLTLKPGVAASKDGTTSAVAPTTRVIPSFKKSGKSFMAADAEQQAELFDLKCVEFAPEGVQLDPEAVQADAAPVKKAAPAAAAVAKTKTPADKIAAKNADDDAAKAAAAVKAASEKSSDDAAVEKAAWNADVSSTDDGNGMI